MATTSEINSSVFDLLGFKKHLDEQYKEIQDLFLENSFPWVIGYSGGKDSTAVVQLIWNAIAALGRSARNSKKIYVISTDTLVENPVVSKWVARSLGLINQRAKSSDMPFDAQMLHPEVENSFWVNLLGKGYPAPRPRFRWCTERLKILPSNSFIYNVANRYGETILALGTRKAESIARSNTMKKYEFFRNRARLSPNSSIANCLVYSPIEDWSNDDVWLFLTRTENPWGLANEELLELYKDATVDRECPLVVDTTTPSCGGSRFGCWVCTLVSRDKSMEAIIANTDHSDWLSPLIKFRDRLDIKNDRMLRDFRRMSGNVQLFHDAPIPGPYLQSTREELLRALLETQIEVNEKAPKEFLPIQLISQDELAEIRRIWLTEKHEIEDRLPKVYEAAMGKPFPDTGNRWHHFFGEDELILLKKVCGTDRLAYEMLRELLDIEWNYRTKLRRAGLPKDIENAIRKACYRDEEDAVQAARKRENLKTRGEDA